MTARVTHWIDGRLWSGTAERTGDVYDPATGKVMKQVDFASRPWTRRSPWPRPPSLTGAMLP